MALDQILSVSGKSGLYRLVGQMKNGIIVEGISDKKRFPVHGSAKVSALEEISIYTDTEEVPLNDVFKTMFDKESGKQALDSKSDKEEIKAYFKSILPEYDPDRVYISDMVKVVKWYNTLIENDAYDPSKEEEADKTEEEGSSEEKAEKKPKKKPAAKAAQKKVTAKSAPKTKTGGGAASPRKSSGAQRGG